MRRRKAGHAGVLVHAIALILSLPPCASAQESAEETPPAPPGAPPLEDMRAQIPEAEHLPHPHAAVPAPAPANFLDLLLTYSAVELDLHWVPRLHDDSGNGEMILLRTVMPFSLAGARNWLRLFLPYHLETPQGSHGLGAVDISNLVFVRLPLGQLGLGGVVSWRPDDGTGDRFGAGPAIFYAFAAGPLVAGLEVDQFFGSPNITRIFPILLVLPLPWFSIGLGDAIYDYNWDTERFLGAPLGFDVSFWISLAPDSTLRIGAAPYYNPQDDTGLPEWRLRFTVGLFLAPGGGG